MRPMTVNGDMAWNPYPMVALVVEGLERSGSNNYGAVNYGSNNRKGVPKGVAVIATLRICRTHWNHRNHKQGSGRDARCDNSISHFQVISWYMS